MRARWKLNQPGLPRRSSPCSWLPWRRSVPPHRVTSKSATRDSGTVACTTSFGMRAEDGAGRPPGPCGKARLDPLLRLGANATFGNALLAALRNAKIVVLGKGMSPLCSLSDSELMRRLSGLVHSERHAMVDVIEHLVEMERRRLYLSLDMPSLYRYCIRKLGYDDDAALKRHRVAKLALRWPQVLDELRAGTMHLTGLFLLARRLREDNVQALLEEARGKSKRQLEQLIARWFPRPDVPPRLEPVGPGASTPAEAAQNLTCSGAGESVPARLEPLSPTRLRVEFTARSTRSSSKRPASASEPARPGRCASSNRARVTCRSRSSARCGSETTRSARSWTARATAVPSGAS
jgi:hypothetical protein